MNTEIGSEFTPNQDLIPIKHYSLANDLYSSIFFLMSGRTALDFIIKDIAASRAIRHVLLPSYCCKTMIIPFISNGINVSFYDIIIGKDASFQINIDSTIKPDMFVSIDYFGFINKEMHDAQIFYKNLGTIIIEDKTQSYFTDDIFPTKAEYTFSSLRKWYATPDGAVLRKHNGSFIHTLPTNEHNAFVDARLHAFRLKARFMKNEGGTKEAYQAKFHEADQILKNDFTGYKMSSMGLQLFELLNITELKAKRRDNASFLIEQFECIIGIRNIFKKVHEHETPLFVPILVKNGLRDALRAHLINHQIYCPVHWPISEHHKISDLAKEIYLNELSIICDQRYNISDMKKIVETIQSFFEYNKK